MLRDKVRLVDGPLEGRIFNIDKTPTVPLDFAAAVGTDGRILAVEGEPAPTNVPFKGVTLRYAPMQAKDGHQSRADDGCLLYYLAAQS